MATLSGSANLGNTSTSALFKSANTLVSEVNTYNDDSAADTFANSLRSDGDLSTYTAYLNGRITQLLSTGSIPDATKAASLNQTLISATHETASANIQRATISVLDGQGTDNDKLAAIGTAFQQLYAVGDLDAAQTYEAQYYSLSQTIQLAQQTAADSLAASQSTSITDAISSVKDTIGNANAAFAAQGPAFLDKQSAQFLKDQGFKTAGVASIFSALAGAVGSVNAGIQLNDNTKYAQGTYTPGSILDTYTQGIVLNPTDAATYQRDIDDYLNGGTGIDLPGGGTVTYNALMNTVYASNSGNAPYEVVQEADGTFGVKAGNVSGYVYGKDMNGNTKLMPTYSFFTATLPTTVKAAFQAAGLNAKQDSNGNEWIQATTSASFLAKVAGNNPLQVAIQKNGSAQFMAGGKLYQLVQGANGGMGVQQLGAYGQVTNDNVAGTYGFVAPKSTLDVGNSTFLAKTLGPSATPTTGPNGQVVYQANGKTYQLVSDAKGLKGLQQIDPTSGKVINANVSGQYGFNPTSKANPNLVLAAQNGSSKTTGNGPNFSDFTSLGGDKLPTGTNSTILNHNGISLDEMVSNAQILTSINSAHNQAMLALAPPMALPTINVTIPAPAPAIKVAASPLANLGVPTASVAPKTVNPQTPAAVNIQPAGSVNLQGSGSGSIKL